jgi:Holliday junction resolvase RusA-like endonuclease
MHQAPVGKERPRVGKGGHIYTPAKTVKFERELGKLGKLKRIEYGLQNLEPWPMHAGLYMVEVIPYKEANGGPDGDNIFKCIDGLNKILWADDRYVSGAFAKPRISARPRVEYDIIAVPMGMVRLPVQEEHELLRRARLRASIISAARGLEEGEELDDVLRELTALVDLERGSL